MKRCDYCGRRLDRPASPYCDMKERHALPDLAQIIAQRIEDDVCGRSGGDHWFEGCDADIQDDIRDTWAKIIRKGLI